MTADRRTNNGKGRGRRPNRSGPSSAAAITEVSAGGIVFKRTPAGVRLALIKDPYGKWTFPKGHREEGESLVRTALRETREEIGLGRLRVIRSLGKIDFWFKDRYREESKGATVHKYVHFYLMEAPSRAKGRPQKEEMISRIAWVTPKQVVRMSGYRDIREVLSRALRWIGENVERAETPAHGLRTERNDQPSESPEKEPPETQ